MHDLVIRGSIIVDGSGAQRYAGDIAFNVGLISQVGGKARSALRDIDARKWPSGRYADRVGRSIKPRFRGAGWPAW